MGAISQYKKVLFFNCQRIWIVEVWGEWPSPPTNIWGNDELKSWSGHVFHFSVPADSLLVYSGRGAYSPLVCQPVYLYTCLLAHLYVYLVSAIGAKRVNLELSPISSALSPKKLTNYRSERIFSIILVVSPSYEPSHSSSAICAYSQHPRNPGTYFQRLFESELLQELVLISLQLTGEEGGKLKKRWRSFTRVLVSFVRRPSHHGSILLDSSLVINSILRTRVLRLGRVMPNGVSDRREFARRARRARSI